MAAERQLLDVLGLSLNAPEPALICRPCGYALKPFGERVSRHLAEKHNVPQSERRGLNGLIKSIGLPDPNEIPLRPDGLPPHPDLTIVIGHACRHCDYRTASTDLISRHVARMHGFKDARQADGWQRDHIRSGLSLQSWSQNGPRGYWEAQPATATTSWMRRTGWAELFDGARRDILVAIPPDDEARLQRIVSAVDGLMDRCEDTVRHTDVSMRCWLQSLEPHRPYKAPFELTGRPSTAHRYRRLIKRLLCFCIRLWRLPLGPRLSQCRRTLTIGQSRALGALWADAIWTSPPCNTDEEDDKSRSSCVCFMGGAPDGRRVAG
ncbi:hypothetical protein LY78DRAFT_708415 [Colletotrichum sublineola]|nr:hypothetical protein LY78DRAFT_708415 [Colletotrichum sublineola]